MFFQITTNQTSLKKYTLSFPSVSEPALAVQKVINLPDKSASFGSDGSTKPFHGQRIFRHRKREIRKLLARAEAIAVLVGATDFLSKPVVAFVRLAYSQELQNMMEVPLPVKFIFIMLGPQNCAYDYHEVGRAVATLMNNKVRSVIFHRLLYNTWCRHLMRGHTELRALMILFAV